ncbi:hypothetical protein [Plastoroseomonas arctica]|uniref:Uncharacterized protein n=1 Tax=Plastoroseomonas arctica TaxID=1509237 RepID=A0AAF1KMN4_9PROT|nr:hypothetical protein [Plastoroseomonas arctica]MBR0653653.1 hypothetical protein [Plastoroseomonas arctica]
MTISILKTKRQMADLAVRLEQAGAGWHAPLIRAAMTDELRLLMLSPEGRVPLDLLDMAKRPIPLVVILAGDNDPPAGPGHFPQARHLFGWARFIMVHGAGGHPLHYEIARDAARAHGRVVIAETTTACLRDWIDFKLVTAPGTPGLVVAPPKGGQHPSAVIPAGTVLQ